MEELSIEITYKCPFKCVMCSSSASLDEKMPVIPFEVIKEMIDDAKEHCGTVDVSLSGGEPTFHPRFVDIVRYIHAKGLRPIIYTIGVDYDIKNKKAITYRNKYIQLFKETNAKVILPIHGLEKTHNKIVLTDNAFNLEMETIKSLVKNNIEVQIHFVPQIYNYREVINVYLLCNKLGVREMSILRFVPQGRGIGQPDLNETQLGITMGMLFTIRRILEYRKEFDEIMSNVYSNENIMFDEFLKTNLRIGIPMDFTFQIDESTKLKSCDGGKSKVLVRATGQVNVCPAWKGLEEYDAGNIYKTRISEIWKHADTYDMFRRFKKEDLNGECKSCRYLLSCMGGCAAQRILFNGNINNGPDPYCMKKKL